MTLLYHLHGREFVTYRQEEPKAEGKRRIVDLRFGNVKVNAQSQRIRYQEHIQLFLVIL